MCDESKCEHPERLEGKPGDCSPEQIKECHGDEADHSCVPEDKIECEHPEKLEGKPGECSPEQIKECHGKDGGHSCE